MGYFDDIPQPEFTECHQPAAQVYSTEIPVTWFAHGLRVVDIRNPHARESERSFLMKRSLAVCVSAGLFALGLTVSAYAQAPVKIGVLTPLSPPGDASGGQFIVRGAKMAAEDINARGGVLGGRKIELVIEDDSGTPEKGLAAFRKLATQDHVSAVIGQYHSSVTLAVQALADEYKIPIFATQATAGAITERHLQYTYRTHAIDQDRVQLWSRWLKERGVKRVALVVENTDFGLGIVEEARKQFKTLGIDAESKAIVVDRAVADLTPQMLELKAWKPDMIINGGVGPILYLIVKQAYDIGLFPATPMLIATDLPARPEYWKNLGEKGTYATFIVHYQPRMKLTARGEAMSRRYREAFKEDPVYPALNAYSQVMLIADAITAAKSDKGEDIAKALLANKFEGWNATVSFTRGDGPYWQQWTPPMLLTQYTRPDMPFSEARIVFPPEFKTGDWVPGPGR
jgi:branched-chain amino acid transport system substrate-binding protein